MVNSITMVIIMVNTGGDLTSKSIDQFAAATAAEQQHTGLLADNTMDDLQAAPELPPAWQGVCEGVCEKQPSNSTSTQTTRPPPLPVLTTAPPAAAHQAVTPVAAHNGTLLNSPALIQLSGRDANAAAAPPSTQRPPLLPRTTPQTNTAASPAAPSSMVKKVVTMALTPQQAPAVTPASAMAPSAARHTPMSLRMAAATPLASGRLVPQHITFQDFLKVCVNCVFGYVCLCVCVSVL